jgi:hypothetical protein
MKFDATPALALWRSFVSIINNALRLRENSMDKQTSRQSPVS